VDDGALAVILAEDPNWDNTSSFKRPFRMPAQPMKRADRKSQARAKQSHTNDFNGGLRRALRARDGRTACAQNKPRNVNDFKGGLRQPPTLGRDEATAPSKTNLEISMISMEGFRRASGWYVDPINSFGEGGIVSMQDFRVARHTSRRRILAESNIPEQS
jgi:hypothetical protein